MATPRDAASTTEASVNEISAVWAEFSAPLRSFVRRRVPESIDADDIVQDIFVRILRNLPSLAEVERLDAWVFRTARSAVADALRAHQRRDARTDSTDLDTLEDIGADDASKMMELTSCLAPFVKQLDEPYRSALELTTVRGLTQQEAAAREGISLSGMKSRVQRARDQMRTQMLRCCEVERDVRGGVIDYAVRDRSVCGPTPASISRERRLQE